ncbi:MAG: flavin reductase family protein [Pseudomonadota bacterium]
MDALTADFRDAMRRVAATVNVVTIAAADGSPRGLTATAVSSLSADPPSLLVCVNQSASLHGALGEAAYFCINVLHQDQAGIARNFSDPAIRERRFETGGWQTDPLGPPYLPDAAVSFICYRDQLIAFATHTIVIGTVRTIRTRVDVDPLVYLDGAYCRIAPA